MESDIEDFNLEFVLKRANNMRIARIKRGLTQADMAKIVGTTQATYSRIETGFVTSPKDEALLRKIAAVLRMSPRRLREHVRVK